MTIVIPEDNNINEIVVDVRDVLYGAELEFDAEKEFQMVFDRKSELYNNAFVSEYVFTIQKSDIKFDSDEKPFIPNTKNIFKIIEQTLQEKYKKLERIIKTYDKSYKKELETKSANFNKRFLKYIKKQYFNVADSIGCQVIIMKKGEKVILGEQAFKESVQLVAVTTVNSSKKLGLDAPDLRNVKITELGLCPVKMLTLCIDKLIKDKKGTFKFNRFIEDKMKTIQQEPEL